MNNVFKRKIASFTFIDNNFKRDDDGDVRKSVSQVMRVTGSIIL